MSQYRIGDILPNPFRDSENYPFNEKKVETLRASFRNTSVWPTIVARIENSHPEIAFGHHRLEAALREYGPDGTIPLNIEDLSDAEMLKMMANENMTEFAAGASVSQETVKQVVKAYAAGRIELEVPDPKSDNRFTRWAPSFLLGDPRRDRAEHPYTTATIAAFLNWYETKVKEALSQLEQIERGTFTATDFHGMTGDQADEAVRAVRHAESRARKSGVDPTTVKAAVAKAVVAASKGKGHEVVRDAGQKELDRLVPALKPASIPLNIAIGIERLIENFFAQGINMPSRVTLPLREVIELIAENRDAEELEGAVGPLADQIANLLTRMANEATRLAATLEGKPVMIGARA